MFSRGFLHREDSYDDCSCDILVLASNLIFMVLNPTSLSFLVLYKSIHFRWTNKFSDNNISIDNPTHIYPLWFIYIF